MIIPTCQRPDLLARCLNLLPRDANVIVTDDSRDDATQQMVARDFPWVRWQAGPRRGPAANRNAGARSATTEWLIFLDDDCLPQPGWLDAYAAAMPGRDVVEGRTVSPGAIDDPLAEYVENLEGDCYWSCNLAIRRAVFQDLGEFDEAFTQAAGEDMEFAWRIRKRGLAVVFAPAAEVHHPVRRASWKQVWRRIWMLRWRRLFVLKVGGSPKLGAPAVWIITHLVAGECLDLLRTTYQAYARPDARRPMTKRFSVATRWVTLPLMLPWLIWWDFRFRRLLKARAKKTASPASSPA